jgi:hypothetical protein
MKWRDILQMTNNKIPQEPRDNVKYCPECNMCMKRISAKKCSYCGNKELINMSLGEGS